MPTTYIYEGRTYHTDDAGRTFVQLPTGWMPVTALQPPPPPTMAQVPAPSLPVMPQWQDLAGQAKAKEAQGQGSAYYADPAYPPRPVKLRGAGKMVRFYSTGLLSTDADYAVGTQAQRAVRLDFPSTLIAIQASTFNTAAGNALPVGVDPLDTFLLYIASSNGEQYTVTARMASTVAGTAKRPGMIPDRGWRFEAGQGMVVGLTPLIASLRIDITLVMLEQRGDQDFANL